MTGRLLGRRRPLSEEEVADKGADADGYHDPAVVRHEYEPLILERCQSASQVNQSLVRPPNIAGPNGNKGSLVVPDDLHEHERVEGL